MSGAIEARIDKCADLLKQVVTLLKTKEAAPITAWEYDTTFTFAPARGEYDNVDVKVPSGEEWTLVDTAANEMHVFWTWKRPYRKDRDQG
jgi:hypothetical protein